MAFLLRSLGIISLLMYGSVFVSDFVFAYERRITNESMSSEEFQRAYDLMFHAESHRGCGHGSCTYSMELVHSKGDATLATAQVLVHTQTLVAHSAQPTVRTLFTVQRGKGTTVLLDKDAILWFYKPRTAHAFRVSPAQTVLGHMSYADLVYTNYVRLYDPIVLEKRMVDDMPVYKITLAKVVPTVAYSSIVLYIADDEGNKPLKAELYNAEVLRKTVYFYTRVQGDNGEPVQEWKIVGAEDGDETTLVRFGRRQDLLLPKSAFTLEGMKEHGQ